MSPVERLSSFTCFDCVEEIDLSVLERFLLLLFFVVFVVVVVLLILGVYFVRDFIVFTKHDVFFLGSSALHAAVPSLPRLRPSEYGQCVQEAGKGCYSPVGRYAIVQGAGKGCNSPGGR